MNYICKNRLFSYSISFNITVLRQYNCHNILIIIICDDITECFIKYICLQVQGVRAKRKESVTMQDIKSEHFKEKMKMYWVNTLVRMGE